MDFTIKCDVFARLAQVTKLFKPTIDPETKRVLECVRLEYRNGHYYAIATNQEIASIQYLGSTDRPDQAVHVVNDDAIIAQAQAEVGFDSSLIVTMHETPTLTSMYGWIYQGAPIIRPADTPMDGWQDWFPDSLPTKNKGIMFWNADHVAALSASAPSGKIYFPEFVDVDKPIVVRDRLDGNWCGLFVPKPEPTDTPIKQGAEIPSWV